MAALTATRASIRQRWRREPPRLQVAEAEAGPGVSRPEPAATGDVLTATPSEIAAAAEVVVSNEPGIDPITGVANTAPTVSIQISARRFAYFGSNAGAANCTSIGSTPLLRSTSVMPAPQPPVLSINSSSDPQVAFARRTRAAEDPATATVTSGTPWNAASMADAAADPSTPEGVVRAFFAALKEARRTDDPALIRPFVTGEQSSAYLSVQGFLLGQKAVKKASVLTVQQLENISVQTTGDSATVQLVYTEGGYDISLDSGEPLESPGVLAPRNVTIELRRVEGRWLVETYEAKSRDRAVEDRSFPDRIRFSVLPTLAHRSGCFRDRPGSRRESGQVDLRGSRLRWRHGHRKVGTARRVANPRPNGVLLRVAEPGQSRGVLPCVVGLCPPNRRRQHGQLR